MLDGEMFDAGVAQQVEQATLNREVGDSNSPTRELYGPPPPPHKKSYPNKRGRGNGSMRWTTQEFVYLIETYNADPNAQDRCLAYDCTLRFGRDITEGAIKGAIYRMRQIGRIQGNRPDPKTGRPRVWSGRVPKAKQRSVMEQLQAA